jgi:hypothetical protein
VTLHRVGAVLTACGLAAGCLVPIGDAQDKNGSGGAAADAGSSGSSGNGGDAGSGGSSGSGASAGSSGGAGIGGSSGDSGAGGTTAHACALPPLVAGDPTLPAPIFDLAMPAVSGTSHAVAADDNLQAVLEKVLPGDEVVIAAGAKFVGNFWLKNLGASDAWVTIRSSESASLPEAQRVVAADAAKMPTLSSPNASPALEAVAGAHHYRLVGIRFSVEPNVLCDNLVTAGSSSATLASEQPHHLVFDRCIFQGEPTIGSRRGIALNAAHAAVLDSRFVDFKSATHDANALSAWNGPGPFLIHNNHLEGSFKSVRIGGQDPSIKDLVPSDVSICNNHITKPLSWKVDDLSFAGTDWRIGFLVAIQSGRRVLISGNVIDRSWSEDGYGTALQIQPSNENGAHTWAIAEDVTIAHNLIRDVGGGLWIDESAGAHPDSGIGRLRVTENLVYDLGTAAFPGNQRFATLLGTITSLTVTDNTVLAKAAIVFLGGPISTLILRDNLFGPTTYGIFGQSAGMGTPALDQYVQSYTVTHNVFVGLSSSTYPENNFFPGSVAQVDFVSLASGDYRLAPSSPYLDKASDGGAIGADIDKLMAITAGVAP